MIDSSKINVTFKAVSTPPLPYGGRAWPYFFGLAACGLLGTWWLDWVSGAQVRACIIGLCPLATIVIGLYAFRGIAAARSALSTAEAVAREAVVRREKVEEALALSARMRGLERDEAGEQLNKIRAQLERAEDLLRQETLRANVEEARARLLSGIEPEIKRLRRENAEHAKFTTDRRAWRTLPQGHDLDSEDFAMAVASALKICPTN